MTTRPGSELNLAADFACSGVFSAVATVREPPLGLSVAIKDLFAHRENPELRPAVVHALATRLAGRCSIRSDAIFRALSACMAAHVAMEWKVTIAAVGTVRALFIVKRIEKIAPPDTFNFALQLAGPPSFEAAQAVQVEENSPLPLRRRACSLLRIF